MEAEQVYSTCSEDEKTISDFGTQWLKYRDNNGYYGSTQLLKDIFGPLLAFNEIKDKRVAEIGSGTGRIVNMLLDVGAAHVVAIEPSESMEVLKDNTTQRKSQLSYIHDRGEAISQCNDLDYIFSIGVLHHIKNPEPIVQEAYKVLKPGGKMLVWLYGHEGNAAYLNLVLPFRKLTKKLSHRYVSIISHILNILLIPYIMCCKFLPLPLRGYFNKVFGKLTLKKRYLVIYDQLNPEIAKYYKKSEALKLLTQAGFKDCKIYHRHGYSWTVIGTKE